MKRVLVFLAAVIGFSGLVMAERGVSVAAKERRTALVIGNSDYKIGRLKNPVNDAEDMAGVLKQMGFRVTLLTNVSQRKMEKAIQRFGIDLRKGGVGLFFYAGHGMQVSGINYLIPIGANIIAEDDIKYESVDANRVLSKMESAGNPLNMVFLDACRDNPFKRSFRSSSRGLAQMDAPPGSLVSYATSPGSTAADGTGRNGVFTKHLLRNISRNGLELSQVMKNTGAGVIRETDRRQIPWTLSSFTGNFYFSGGGTAGATAAAVSTRPKPASPKKRKRRPSSEETELWNMVKNSTIDEMKMYLGEYPNGFCRKQAEERIWYLTYSTVESMESYLKKNPKGKFSRTAEDRIWGMVVASNDIGQLRSFYRKHPGSRYRSKADEMIWREVTKSNELEQFERYLKDNPGSRRRAIAKLRIARLKMEEDRLWQSARNTNDVSVYEEYLSRYPDGR
ncbi:MAG: caspase family protein [Proteobacteria bacterium]|nr:caspase family protein [Pseudomonadota bacterium]